MRFILTIVFIALVVLVQPSSVTVQPPNLLRCDDIRVIDADTVEADIHLPYSVVLNDQSIRALDFDAWEASKRRSTETVKVTDEEVAMGKKAKDELIALCADAELFVDPRDGKRDSRGRPLGALWLKFRDGEWLSLAQWANDNGHVRNN